METRTHIVLNTKNDKNGNPRRISLLIDDGRVIETYDHGYRGEPIPKDGWPYAAVRVHCAVNEYQGWINFKPEEKVI